MIVRVAPRARRDLAAIAAHVDPYGAETSARIIGAIEATIIRAGRSPLAGRPQDMPNVRRMVTRRYGYVVYYNFDQDEQTVDVLSICHGRQLRPYADR